jgi:nucleoside-diphosphate kinase
MKMIKISPEEAEKFYSHLNGKLPNSVFNSIVKYMSSEKIIVMVWQGKGVVKKVREICGPTDPKKTKKYHIRNLSEDSLEEEFKKGKAVKNIIHSSATREEAERELKFFFKEES